MFFFLNHQNVTINSDDEKIYNKRDIKDVVTIGVSKENKTARHQDDPRSNQNHIIHIYSRRDIPENPYISTIVNNSKLQQ